MLKRILIVPDTHRPYHNVKAWGLMLKAAKAFKPHTVVCIGDLADFYSVSSHSKDPQRISALEDEVADVNVALDELDALGAEDKHFIAGNHCLTTDHRVLTKQGWATVNDLNVGDRIATRGPDGTLEWQPVERIVRRPLGPTEALYTYESNQGLSLACTESHNVVGHSNDIWWRRPAKDCPNEFDVPQCVNSGLPEYPLSDEALRVAAWASTDVHYRPSDDSVTFYQSETGKEKVLEADLDAYGVTYRKRSRNRAPHSIVGKVLKSHKTAFEYSLSVAEGRKIRALTGLSKKGALPSWVSQLSDRQWGVFVEVLLLADGSKATKTDNAWVFNGSKELCDAVLIAAVTHGWRASISEYRPGSFRVNLTRRNKVRVTKWHTHKHVHIGCEVWCPTVANGNFLTERNNKVHVTGNCDRLTRYLKDKAPQLFGVVSIPSLFNLKERGWTYTPYKQHRRIGKVHFTHDVDAAGRNSTFKALDTYQHSVVTGHAHRMQYIVEGNAVGECKLAAQFGWLGDADKIDYMHRAKVNKDWALGFGIGYLDESTGLMYLTPVPIVNLTCVVEGKLYRG